MALLKSIMRPIFRPIYSATYNASSSTPAFLSLFPNASPAYSTRQLSTSPTDVVRVRRDNDDEEGFTANEVRNGTLLNYVVPTDVQALYSNRMYFDGVDDGVTFSPITLSGDFSIKFDCVIKAPDGDVHFFSNSAAGQARFAQARFFCNNQGDGGLGTFGINTDNGSLVAIQHLAILGEKVSYEARRTGSTITFYENNVSIGSGTSSDTITLNSIGLKRGAPTGLKNMLGTIYNTEIDNNGTILSYDGDGNQNSNWVDTTGSNDGTVVGSPALFTGQGFNGYVSVLYDQKVPTSKDRMYFDGVDDAVVFTGYKGITGSVARTLSFEFSTTNNTSNANDNNVLNYGATLGFNGNVVAINIEQGKIAVRVASGFVAFGDGSLNDGNLHKVAIVFPPSPNTNNLKCFVDGVELPVDSIAAQSIDTGADVDLKLGQYASGAHFLGIISDLNFFNTNLSDADAQAFTSGATIAGAPVFSVTGYGNTNADWEDQIGSNDGTIEGDPARALPDLSAISADATQTTAANQPLIVENGAIVTKNGKAGLKVDGTNDYMQATIDGLQDFTDLSVFIVNAPTAAAAANITTVITHGFGTTGSDKALAWGQSTGIFGVETVTLLFENSTFTIGRLGSSSYARSAGQQELLTTTNLSTGTKLYQNGSEVTLNLKSGIDTSTDTSPSNTGYTADNKLYLFSYESGSGITQSPEAIFQEFVVFDSDLGSTRADVEDNIIKYWGIT